MRSHGLAMATSHFQRRGVLNGDLLLVIDSHPHVIYLHYASSRYEVVGGVRVFAGLVDELRKAVALYVRSTCIQYVTTCVRCVLHRRIEVGPCTACLVLSSLLPG